MQLCKEIQYWIICYYRRVPWILDTCNEIKIPETLPRIDWLTILNISSGGRFNSTCISNDNLYKQKLPVHMRSHLPRRFCSSVTVGLQVAGSPLRPVPLPGTAHARPDIGVTSSSGDVTRTSILVVPFLTDDFCSSICDNAATTSSNDDQRLYPWTTTQRQWIFTYIKAGIELCLQIPNVAVYRHSLIVSIKSPFVAARRCRYAYTYMFISCRWPCFHIGPIVIVVTL